jgi:DNA-binding MarR family transcriptional regulator
MTLLGYLYNEEFGIWTKEGVKSIQDGKPHFHFLRYTKKRNKTTGRITQLQKEKIIEYRNKGYSMGKISRKTGISDSSVCKIIKEYEDKNQTH